MSIENQIICYALIALFSIAFFILTYTIAKNHAKKLDETKEERQKQKDETKYKKDTKINKWLKKRRTGIFSYVQIEKMLTETGEKYRAKQKEGKEPTPADYIEECFLTAIAGGVIAVVAVWLFMGKFENTYTLAFIPGFFIFFNFKRFFMRSNDKEDNKKMLADINSMYEALKISTTAGIPLIDGLKECYRQVKNPRLKAALSEISSGIRGGKDMETLINNFRAQFTSPEIVQFCIVIRQSLETGRKEEMLMDLSANMRDIQNEINHQIEENLNTKVQLIQLGMLFLLVIVMLYAVMTTLTTQMHVL